MTKDVWMNINGEKKTLYYALVTVTLKFQTCQLPSSKQVAAYIVWSLNQYWQLWRPLQNTIYSADSSSEPYQKYLNNYEADSTSGAWEPVTSLPWCWCTHIRSQLVHYNPPATSSPFIYWWIQAAPQSRQPLNRWFASVVFGALRKWFTGCL